MNQVTFGSIRSQTDLGLTLIDVNIGIPDAKRILVDVPGRDGVLDLSPGIRPQSVFQNRKITLSFVMADYQKRWISLFSGIVTQLHGKRFHVVIEPDINYYWDAFCSVDTAQCDRNKGTVTVELDADPYKYKISETTYNIVAASSGREQICVNSRMQVNPSFYATDSGITVRFGDVEHTLAEVTPQSFADIAFTEGNNEILVTGTAGTVTVTYREGIL